MNQDDFLRRRCVAARFSDAARFHPETVALVDRERQWSYGELDRRTTLLAAELIRRGIGIGDAVGLHLDRSAELCLGMLASHRAGGCYVPLDPAWPEERRRFIAGETDCKVILSVSTLSLFAEQAEQTLLLDRFDWDLPSDAGFAMPPNDPRRLAYILYTSGSTGVPKGVEIEHAGLANFVHCQIEQFPHRRNFRTTQAARPGFDASGSEIWPALCSGATLYIIPGELLLYPAKLAAWLAANEIDECFLPTPLAELLLEEGMPAGAALRVLRTGGDRLTRKPPADFPAVLVNEYGPTECSIVSHYAVFRPGESASPPPDIGYPLDNLHASIRDGELRPLPDGETGEICLGGIGLARGYHRRPDLDAVAFAADPLRPGERLYRTGDLGIRRPDGRFEFIGRKDFQIKLRGQRIELGEIEQVIAAHPAVAKCVAALRNTAAGTEYLATYVTLRSKLADPGEELLDLARRKLPAYMVPATLTVLDAMPLSANGKIDRAALPDPTVPDDARREPETEVEQRVAEFWRQLLGGELPSLGDHFFRSGGDSLKAAEFALELGDRFDFAAPAGLLFDHPVLGELAAVVTACAGTGGGDVLTRVPGPAPVEFPATGYQLAPWKLELVSGCPTLNHIVIAIHLEGRIDAGAIKQTFSRLVAENQSLRSGFAWDGRELRQRVAPEVAIDLPEFDWSGLAPAEREANFERLVETYRKTPFKLDAPPLFRLALCRFEDTRVELLFAVSHLIFDGWSGALVLDRLRGGGAAAAGSRPDYADFAARCQALAASGGDRRGLAAWRTMLADFRPMPELPFEVAGDPADRAAGRFQFTLPGLWCERLKSYAATSGTTLFTLLQAVLQLQLHKYTGVTDIVTGTAFANRKLRHTEAIVGMFINSLPLRHRFDPEQSFAEFVRSFGETVRQALEYGEIPLDAILEETGLNRLNAPLFPVSLLLQNLPWPENAEGQLRIGYDELGSGIAKTDLTFTMEERGGGLDCHVEYRRSRFSPQSVAEFCDAFRLFAETLLDHPDRPILELDCAVPAASRPGVYLVGGTGLLPVCGGMLREHGFQLLGVFSADPAVTQWAEVHRIPRFEPEEAALARVLRRIRFDYLFSIVNGVILKPEVLALPRRAAINYHDAPLPRYAGLNAVSWAVINRETLFGVTWHRMDAGVDAGSICGRKSFAIAPGATALELSFQCTAAAAAAFAELVEDLTCDRLQTIAQNPAERTFYLASDRPFAGAMLDWNRGTDELAALVRGLELGTYDNELALPKFCRDGEVVLAAAAEIVAAAAPLPPFGTVIAADASGITVATGDGALKLGRLRDRRGRALEATLFRVGENLSLAAHFDPARLDLTYRAAARNESFWVKALAGLEPPPGWRAGSIALPLSPVAGFEPAVIFALFLARLAGGEKVVLGLRFREEGAAALPAGFLLENTPLLLEVDFAVPARLNAERGAAALDAARSRRQIPGDLGLRRRAAAAAT
ncbi:MAG: amino acid adenylation domain-containing protein, partial [Victivallaceae bacterium]